MKKKIPQLLSKVNFRNYKPNREKQEYLQCFYATLLNKHSISEAEKYYNSLLVKLVVHNDWKTLFLSEQTRILKKVSKKRESKKFYEKSGLQNNLFLTLNSSKNFIVESSCYDNSTILSMYSNDDKNTFSFFIKDSLKNFTLNNTSLLYNPSNRNDIYKHLDGKYNTLARLALLGIVNYKQSINFTSKFQRLYNATHQNCLLGDVFSQNLVDIEIYLLTGMYTLTVNEVSYYIDEYLYQVQYFAMCHYLLYLKTCLKNNHFNLKSLDPVKDNFLISRKNIYNDAEYRHIGRQFIKQNNARFSLTSFGKDKINTLYSNIIENKLDIITKVPFEQFSEIFNSSTEPIEQKIEWKGSVSLLVYFINKLVKHNYIHNNNIWDITLKCFNLKTNSTAQSLASISSRQSTTRPHNKKVIDSYFQESVKSVNT